MVQCLFNLKHHARADGCYRGSSEYGAATADAALPSQKCKKFRHSFVFLTLPSDLKRHDGGKYPYRRRFCPKGAFGLIFALKC
jgi:hypothetical protein